MLRHPKLGQRIQCWYAVKTRSWRPLHGEVGIVEIVCPPKARGPRNHGVRIKGELHVVPAGNLRPAPDEQPFGGAS